MHIIGLIVAAGFSSRADGYKMQYTIQEKPLIERAIITLLPFCEKVYVVTGHNDQIIKSLVSHLSSVEVVFNPNYEKGMFSSIKAGVQKITCDRLIFMPGDYGIVKKTTVKQLLARDEDVIIPSYQYNSGHPIVIKGTLLKDILVNQTYNSLKDFVKDSSVEYVEVDDIGILKDIDTDKDYKEVLECIKNEN